MNRTTLLVAVVAALVAVTGAAAAAPAGIAAADDGGTADTAEASAPADAVEQAGPPDDLPEPVPDFVSEIHSLITQFIDGTVDSLGSAVSDVAGGDRADSGDGESADES